MMIVQLITKLRAYPVVISLQDEAVPVTNIDFPAVTLCPSLNVDVENFDYESVSESVKNGSSTIEDLPLET